MCFTIKAECVLQFLKYVNSVFSLKPSEYLQRVLKRETLTHSL